MRQLAGLSALLLGLLFLPAFAGTLTLRTAIEILYFGLFATAFNLLFTHGGMLSFGFNASFAASAYAFALFTNYAPSLSPPFAIVLAIAGGGFISAFIGGILRAIERRLFFPPDARLRTVPLRDCIEMALGNQRRRRPDRSAALNRPALFRFGRPRFRFRRSIT